MKEECSRRGNSICRGLQVEKRKMPQRRRNNPIWEASSGPSLSRTGKSSPATASGALASGSLPSPAAAEGVSPRSGGASPSDLRRPPGLPPGVGTLGPHSRCFQQQPRPCSPEASVRSGSAGVCFVPRRGAVSVTLAPRPNPVQPVFVRKVLLETASPFH